jgi:predicted transcriptional regulator
MDQEPNSTVALFAIHPRYAAGILGGTKRVEFRRSRPKANISHIVIYATSPTKRVLGLFSVDDIVEGPPSEIWERFKLVAGIDEAEFFEYYAGSEVSVVFVIGRVKALSRPMPLSALKGHDGAPQSYEYLPQSVLSLLPSLQ